jgi:hypothetical protein
MRNLPGNFIYFSSRVQGRRSLLTATVYWLGLCVAVLMAVFLVLSHAPSSLTPQSFGGRYVVQISAGISQLSIV